MYKLQPRPTGFSPCDSEQVVTSSQVNVFKLGDVFQQLVKLLSMEQNPILARSAALAILPLCNKVHAVLFSHLNLACYACCHDLPLTSTPTPCWAAVLRCVAMCFALSKFNLEAPHRATQHSQHGVKHMCSSAAVRAEMPAGAKCQHESAWVWILPNPIT